MGLSSVSKANALATTGIGFGKEQKMAQNAQPRGMLWKGAMLCECYEIILKT
jgi:hypothetical protein